MTLSRSLLCWCKLGKKKSLVTPPLDIAGHFYGGCQRQRWAWEGQGHWGGQLVRRDRGLDLSCQHGMDMSQMSQRKKVKKVKKMKSDFDFWPFFKPPPTQRSTHPLANSSPPPRRPACVASRGNPGIDWWCRSIMLSRHRPPICPAIEIYFSMNADGMDRHSAARHSSAPSMERRYRVT